MDVPVASSLNDVYAEDSLPLQKSRWNNLLSQFKEKYGRPANFVSRSPGRVNLIGEHIDYSLYEVLPMAVEVDVLLAVAVHRPSDEPIARLCNVNHGKFEAREFDVPLDGNVEIDNSSLEWTNYFKAGLRGASELLRKKRGDDFRAVGMDILVDGTVPSGGGLSSSAAFVCASALAVLRANGEEKVNQTEMVELAIVSERAVGVFSGGMDQSASVFPQRGKALYVSFKPSLSVKHVEFPATDPELTFVVAQSFVAADKHVTAPVCYNLRVVEVSLAAALLAKIFRLEKPLPEDSGPLGVSLRGFHNSYFEEKEGVPDNSKTSVPDFAIQLQKLVTLVEDYLIQEEGYTREDISMILGMSVEDIEKRFMSKFTVRADRFMLRQRALHVFTEAQRVLKFMDLLASPPSEGGSQALLKGLGDLMNETQDSCRDVFDCSCPELDELCQLARGAGAYGSRLTGAGWGGCSVHLVPKHKVDKVKETWETRYYKNKFPDITEEKLSEAVVVSKPGSGSCVFIVKDREEV